MIGVYFDYRLKFPVTGLATALQAMAALHIDGILGTGNLPENMLGSARDNSGSVASANVTWKGEQGIAASSYTDQTTSQVINVPARGDPSYYYIHIRATIDPMTLPFDPATYGLIPSTPKESADVLGVWA